ncbi:MAG: hypothetical protein LKH11_09225 [Solobacterium sp.]|nr:hypothetical protein [Solobacterium sp.]MCI1346852.1 hypothetical protein [Solobacterium sp.]MCI1408422.1 hypothetical protein [Solobacterium sp.]MCI1436576.1 hypothetical protein [Solobacterium sp.]MCI1458889.1 hypothetical protein [Solobacterium sp.]
MHIKECLLSTFAKGALETAIDSELDKYGDSFMLAYGGGLPDMLQQSSVSLSLIYT